MRSATTKVLIVDDDISILDLLTDILEECGHVPIRATNGQEALTLAQQHHPQIVITDIMMPVMDGCELLRAIRSVPELEHTVVVLASAGVSRLAALEASYPADGYMQKPFYYADIEQLVQSVATS